MKTLCIVLLVLGLIPILLARYGINPEAADDTPLIAVFYLAGGAVLAVDAIVFVVWRLVV